MNKKLLFCSAALAALSVSMVSCSKDEAEETNQPTNIGTLSSGTSLDADLPEGYRISSVDDISYYYDNNGRLEAISYDDEPFVFENGTFSFRFEEEDGYVVCKTLVNSSNLISSISTNINFSDGNYSEKGTITCSFNYNSNKQLASFSLKEEFSGYEDGERFSESYTEKYVLTYSGKKLTNVKCNFEEREDGERESGTISTRLNYDEDYPNHFFQYTHGLVERAINSELDILGAFFYVGLLGKASSSLPTSVSRSYTDSDGKEYERENKCGPYTYNSYQALKSAGEMTYKYTTVATNASRAFCPTAPSALKPSALKQLFKRSAQRHHKARR